MSDAPTPDELVRAVAFAALGDEGDIDIHEAECMDGGTVAVRARWKGVHGGFLIQVGDWQDEGPPRLPQAVAALRAVMEQLDRLRPPDPHGPGDACLDCENDRRMRVAIAEALGLEGDDT